MCIPLNAPGIPFPTAAQPEVIVVYAPASGKGRGGTPALAPGAAGPPLRCSLQDAAGSGQSVSRDNGMEPAPFGLARYVIRTDVDPGVLEADQRIDWTANLAGPLASPVQLLAEGPAQPPHGAAGGWITCATARI